MNDKKLNIIIIFFTIALVGLILFTLFRARENSVPSTSAVLRGYEINNEQIKNDKDLREKYNAEFKEIREKINKNPDNLGPWMQLASIKTAVGDYKGAEQVYLYINDRFPDIADSYAALGSLYTYHLEKYSEAEAMFNKAVELNPNKTQVWRDFYDLYKYKLKSQLAALGVLERAAEANPNDSSLWLLLAQEYEDAGLPEKAEQAREKAQ